MTLPRQTKFFGAKSQFTTFFFPIASYAIYIAVLIGVAHYIWKQSTRLSANGPTS